MKLDELNFGIACAISTTTTWLLFSIFFMAMPFGMMGLGDCNGGNSYHMNMGFQMYFTFLFYWILISGFAGWLLAFTYNRLSKQS